MEINISKLSEGTHVYTLAKSCAELGLDSLFSGNATAIVELEKTSNQILLRVETSALGNFVCDRCASDFEKEITATFHSAYVWDAKDHAGLEGEDFYIIAESENIIDISRDVKEYIALAVPFKRLCKEDCAGLCATCGTNLNETQCDCNKTKEIDPRWSKLQEILHKKVKKNLN